MKKRDCPSFSQSATEEDEFAVPEAVRKAMAGQDLDWEIIFVDDGSRDRSREILHRLERENSRIQPMLLARSYGHRSR